jgi:hypothetical protein
MKEKKGKKSLVDLDNLVVKRSTRLKQLLQPTVWLGTNSTRISADSIVPTIPTSASITNDSIKMCEFLGTYEKTPNKTFPVSAEYKSDLVYIGGGGGDVGGWYFLNDGYKPRPSVSDNDWTYDPFNNESGYIFVYFSKTYVTENINQTLNGVCTNCERISYFIPEINSCRIFQTNQGKIFTLLIQNISQINALNLNYAYQSDKNFLSTAINNAINSNSSLEKFIDDIRSRNNNDSTPILSYDPVHPLSLFGDNVLPFSCMQNDTFNILDKFINTQTFSANSNFLSLSDVKKLPFDVKGISGISGLAELGNNNTTIKFLSSGVCTIFYQVEPFNDVENIFKNLNEPSFYEVKGFSLKISAIVTPLLLKFKVLTIPIELLNDGNIKKIDLSELLIDTNIDIKNIDKNDLQYKLEPIPNTQFNVTSFTSDNRTFIAISSSLGEGGCKLTVSYINNNEFSTSVNLFWKFKGPDVFFTLNPPDLISFSSTSTVVVPLRMHVQEPNLNVYVYNRIKLLPPVYSYDLPYFYLYSTNGDYRNVTFSIKNLQGTAYINSDIVLDIEVYSPFSPGKCDLIANYKNEKLGLELNWQVNDAKNLVIKLMSISVL